jgi:hypothetical protein
VKWRLENGRLVIPGSADELLLYYYKKTGDFDKAYLEASRWLANLAIVARTDWNLEDYQTWQSDLDLSYANSIMKGKEPSQWTSVWNKMTGLKNWFSGWLSRQIGSKGTAQVPETQPTPVTPPDYRPLFFLAIGAILLLIITSKSSGSQKQKANRA